jgi:hypothetical protein
MRHLRECSIAEADARRDENRKAGVEASSGSRLKFLARIECRSFNPLYGWCAKNATI